MLDLHLVKRQATSHLSYEMLSQAATGLAPSGLDRYQTGQLLLLSAQHMKAAESIAGIGVSPQSASLKSKVNLARRTTIKTRVLISPGCRH